MLPLYGKAAARAKKKGITHQNLCKTCHTRNNVAWKQRTPEARKRYSIARRKRTIYVKYGLTEERYFEILEEQGGHCAICPRTDGRKKQQKQSPTPFHFAVDHDHDTGATRGLLCDTCNRALGMFCDNPELLRSAIEYLRKHGKVGPRQCAREF